MVWDEILCIQDVHYVLFKLICCIFQVFIHLHTGIMPGALCICLKLIIMHCDVRRGYKGCNIEFHTTFRALKCYISSHHKVLLEHVMWLIGCSPLIHDCV